MAITRLTSFNLSWNAEQLGERFSACKPYATATEMYFGRDAQLGMRKTFAYMLQSPAIFVAKILSTYSKCS